MKITLESTSELVSLDGVCCRVWDGTTPEGTVVRAYIAALRVSDEQAHTLEQDLLERREPVLGEAFPAERQAPQTGTPVKRFFYVDDDGCIDYHMVARDMDHAKAMFRKAGVTFGPDEVPIDQATTLEWTELTPEQAAERKRCHTEDDRGIISLADAQIGDWFCSEW